MNNIAYDVRKIDDNSDGSYTNAYKWINKTIQPISKQELLKRHKKEYYVLNNETKKFHKKDIKEINIGDIVISTCSGRFIMIKVNNNNLYIDEKLSIEFQLTDYDYIIDIENDKGKVDYISTIKNNIYDLINGAYVFGFDQEKCKDTLSWCLIGQAFYDSWLKLNANVLSDYDGKIPNYATVLNVLLKKIKRLLAANYPCDNELKKALLFLENEIKTKE